MKSVLKFAAIAVAALTLQSADASARENNCGMNFFVTGHHNPVSFDVAIYLQLPGEDRELLSSYRGFQANEVNDFARQSAKRVCASANNPLRLNDPCTNVRYTVSGALKSFGIVDCAPATHHTK